MFYTPSSGPEGWRALLADPEKHWRTGYSAKALAYCWEEAQGFPKSVSEVLRTSSVPGFANLQFLLGIPEHKVPLPPLSGRPSQNDLFVLARTNGRINPALQEAELVSIMVEGKVSESFDKLLSDWKQEMTSGKRERLGFLCRLLELPDTAAGACPGSPDAGDGRPPGAAGIDHIRYQLLHRTASALIEAERFCAPHALMLVHSFSQTYEHFDDYAAFARLFGVEAGRDQIVHVGQRAGKELYLGWVRGGEAEYLTR